MRKIRKFGKFEFLRPFASSPSLPLFEAQDPRLGRCVVLLLPKPDEAAAAHVVPFLDGAPAITALRHPNIARACELGVEEGLPYIVMEPVQGIQIDALIRSGPSRSAEWKVHVVSQICGAVAYAHSRDVIHLHLRPANVFVTPVGEVTVVGFGAAPLCTAGIEKAAVGVDIRYMAPEQIAGDSVDHRADILSVGALAYDLFSDRPFSGGGPREALADLPSLPETEYSPRLEAIVMKALARNPDDRHQRMAEMRKAMDDLVSNSVDAFFARMLQADSPPARPAPDQAGAPASTADNGPGAGSKPDKVQVLYNVALGQAAEGRLEEASKLAKAIRRLAPDDPRNNEMTAYLLVEAETAVKAALASSPPGPRARALRQRLERLRVAHGNAGPAPHRHEPRSMAGQ